MPARTARTWASSAPISTASSSASWARPFSSARFSFSTLIFSMHETGSPSGVRQTGNSLVSAFDMLLAPLPSMRWRQVAQRREWQPEKHDHDAGEAHTELLLQFGDTKRHSVLHSRRFAAE